MAAEIIDTSKKRAIKGVLMDMDGLVLDTEKLYTRFWAEAARFYGYPMTREQGLGMRSLTRSVGEAKLKSYFGPEIDYDLVRKKRIELMDKFIEENGVEPMEGIFELLDYLDEKEIPAAIATSSPVERAMAHLGSCNLAHRFKKIISGYMVEKGKPAPDIYIYAAHQLGLEPEDCIALEDSPAGLLAGNRAGCMAVMVPDQDQPDEETLKLLYAKCDSLRDVINLIE